MRAEQIYMPRTLTELMRVNGYYNATSFSGCCGSIDVVHVKWSNCPTGDYNHAKGKEMFPSLGFQCITDYNHRILSIYGPPFGSRNDMDIVKTDDNVHAMWKNWLFRNAEWEHHAHNGHVQKTCDMYLISDNGYFCWPMTNCPFTWANNASPKGYFSMNLESVWKDVECTFGILKKR